MTFSLACWLQCFSFARKRNTNLHKGMCTDKFQKLMSLKDCVGVLFLNLRFNIFHDSKVP